jgi:hypothetical protein
MVHVASIVGALSGCRGMAWFSRLCVRLTGLSQLRHGKIPFSHMEGVPTLCPKIPIYTPGRFAVPFLILFLAYIGACADWRACPALSKVLEAIGGKEWGWVCSDKPPHSADHTFRSRGARVTLGSGRVSAPAHQRTHRVPYASSKPRIAT